MLGAGNVPSLNANPLITKKVNLMKKFLLAASLAVFAFTAQAAASAPAPGKSASAPAKAASAPAKVASAPAKSASAVKAK